MVIPILYLLYSNCCYKLSPGSQRFFYTDDYHKEATTSPEDYSYKVFWLFGLSIFILGAICIAIGSQVYRSELWETSDSIKGISTNLLNSIESI
jgi:hypothetical protein